MHYYASYLVTAATLVLPILGQTGSNCTASSDSSTNLNLELPSTFNASGIIDGRFEAFYGNITRVITSTPDASSVSDRLYYNVSQNGLFPGASTCAIVAGSINSKGRNRNCSDTLSNECSHAIQDLIFSSFNDVEPSSSGSPYCVALQSAMSNAASNSSCAAFASQLRQTRVLSRTLDPDCPTQGLLINTTGSGLDFYDERVGSVYPMIISSFEPTQGNAGAQGGASTTSLKCLNVRVEVGSRVVDDAGKTPSQTGDVPKTTETKVNFAGRNFIAWELLVGGLVASLYVL